MIIKSGGRGRPLNVDLEALYGEYNALIPKATIKLAELRKETKGLRDTDIFGTQTSLPKWVEEGRDILEASIDFNGRIPTYSEIKDIKQTMQTLKQLSSKQARVFGRALAPQLKKQYESALTQWEKQKSDFLKTQADIVKKHFAKLTPRQQQTLLSSKYYQDPKTLSPYGTNIKAIKKWAEKDSGRIMTKEEATAYLLRRRIEDGLNDLFGI